jgi:hypothetical protein
MTLSIPEKHQLNVACRTMKMHCTGARIMGGMGDNPHRRAAEIIHRLTGKSARIDPDCTCVARQGKGDR